MDSIKIVISADATDLDKTSKKLENLGTISQENSKKFEETGKKHTQALHETGTEVDRIEGKMRNLAERIAATFAVERILEFAKESVLAFAEAEKGLKQLEFAITTINGQGRGAFLKLTEQSEKLSKSLKNLYTPAQLVSAQKQLATFGLTSKQIEKLLPQVIDMASATGKDLPEAIEKSILAINGQTKGLRDAGISFKDTGSKTENLAKLQGDLAKFTGAASDELDTESGKLKTLGNYFDILKESIGDFLTNYANDLEGTFSTLFGSETFEDNALKLLKRTTKKVNDARLIAAEEMTKSERQEEKIRVDKNIQAMATANAKGGPYWKINQERVKLEQEYYKQLSDIDKEGNAKIQDDATKEMSVKEDKTKDHFARLLDLYNKFHDELAQAEIDAEKDGTQKQIKELELKFQKQKEEFQKEETELIALEHDKNKNVRIAAQEDLDLLHAVMEASQEAFNEQMMRLAEASADEQSKAKSDAVQKDLKKRLKDQKESEEIFSVELHKDILRQLRDKEITQEEFDKKDIENQIAVFEIKKSNLEKGSLEYRQIEEKELELQIELQKKADEKIKKNIQDTVDNIKQVAEFGFKIAEDVINANIDAIDRQEQMQKDSIDKQRQLAIAGKDNDLAFEEKRQADLEKKRQQEKKKLMKLKELETFLNSVASFSKDDPKSAVAKALAELAIVKGVEASFAEEGGLVGQIKEKSWLGRKHKGGGDILVHAQTGEGILSRNDISNMGGEQAFLNFKNMLNTGLPPIPMSGVMFQGMDTKKLEDKLDNLEKAFKNKKETYVDWESHGVMNVTTVENGIKDTVKHILRKPRI